MPDKVARRDVFVSYSSADKQWADAATAVLERQRVRCWVAPRDITPGMEWGAAIIEGIDSARVMVLIFSERANASPQVRREVERAISKGLAVVPFRIENVAPAGSMEYALGNTHWLDAFTPPAERQLERLADAVRALLGRPLELPAPSHPPAVSKSRPPRPARAREPSPRDERGGARLPTWALVAGACAAVVCLTAAIATGLYLTGMIGRTDRPGAPEDAGAGVPADSPPVVRAITCDVTGGSANSTAFVLLTHQHPTKSIRDIDLRVTLTPSSLLKELRDSGIDTRPFQNPEGAEQGVPRTVSAKSAEWTAGVTLRIPLPKGDHGFYEAATVTGTGIIDGRPVRIEATVKFPGS